MSISIFGAGLSGLIAARMLADQDPTVYEQKSTLPNNHKAVLRFRSSVVGDVTNIPFTKVKVIKGVHRPDHISGNPVRDAIAYSMKVSGKLHERSVLDLDPVERYVAPTNLIERLASTARIEYDRDFLDWTTTLYRPHDPIISTIPLPYMMELFEWGKHDLVPDWGYSSGWTARGRVADRFECAMNLTVYNPYPASGNWYRATINGPDIIIEGVNSQPDVDEATMLYDAFGLAPGHTDRDAWKVSQATYQKISEPTPDEKESIKRFVMWLSEKHQIYSLGRFATWRPKLLLDDVVNDVRVISRLIEGESRYAERVGHR